MMEPVSAFDSMHFPTAEFGATLAAVPHPLVFVTVSGAHLYGFPSADSDFDLRGSHLLPGEEFWGLDTPVETLEPQADTEAGLVEIVSHDLRKFVRLLLRPNGYVLEQLTSPLVVRTTPVHAELLRLLPGLLTRGHYFHYRGFYHSERRAYDRSEPKSIKKLLYAYRVLMTGCVLMREGLLEANLLALNERFGYRFLEELIELKATVEKGTLDDDRPYVAQLEHLAAELDRAYAETALPEQPSVRAEMERLVVDVRRNGLGIA